MNQKIMSLSLSTLIIFLSLVTFTANGFASDNSWDKIKKKGERSEERRLGKEC